MADCGVGCARFVMRAVMLLCFVAAAAVSSRTSRAEERVFPLEEVSVFDLSENAGREFLIGQRTICGDKPDPNVAQYPAFVSDRPIYGMVNFSDPTAEE